MENINFIPATKLPVAEGEQVDVLCLENGEMKRKPADGLGGGGSAAVIICYDDETGESIATPNAFATIMVGFTNAIGIPLIAYKRYSGEEYSAYTIFSIWTGGNDDGLGRYVQVGVDGRVFRIFEDGTVTSFEPD